MPGATECRTIYETSCSPRALLNGVIPNAVRDLSASPHSWPHDPPSFRSRVPHLSPLRVRFLTLISPVLPSEISNLKSEIASLRSPLIPLLTLLPFRSTIRLARHSPSLAEADRFRAETTCPSPPHLPRTDMPTPGRKPPCRRFPLPSSRTRSTTSKSSRAIASKSCAAFPRIPWTSSSPTRPTSFRITASRATRDAWSASIKANGTVRAARKPITNSIAPGSPPASASSSQTAQDGNLRLECGVMHHAGVMLGGT